MKVMSELPQDIIERYNIKIDTFPHEGKENTIYGIGLDESYIGVINPTILENEFRWELKSTGSSVALFKDSTYVHVTCY
jgi:hypothetical protein